MITSDRNKELGLISKPSPQNTHDGQQRVWSVLCGEKERSCFQKTQTVANDQTTLRVEVVPGFNPDILFWFRNISINPNSLLSPPTFPRRVLDRRSAPTLWHPAGRQSSRSALSPYRVDTAIPHRALPALSARGAELGGYPTRAASHP